MPLGNYNTSGGRPWQCRGPFGPSPMLSISALYHCRIESCTITVSALYGMLTCLTWMRNLWDGPSRWKYNVFYAIPHGIVKVHRIIETHFVAINMDMVRNSSVNRKILKNGRGMSQLVRNCVSTTDKKSWHVHHPLDPRDGDFVRSQEIAHHQNSINLRESLISRCSLPWRFGEETLANGETVFWDGSFDLLCLEHNPR